MRSERSSLYRDGPEAGQRIGESNRWLWQRLAAPIIEAMERDAALLSRGIWPKNMRRGDEQ